MKKLIKRLFSSFLSLLFLTLILGFFYPMLVFFCGKLFFSQKANGSLVYQEGTLVGSALIGQNFSEDRYFHPRPSYAGDKGYDAIDSSASCLAVTSSKLEKQISQNALNYRKINGLSPEAPLPVDAITASASGLDPHISPENAHLQIPRIARTRHLSEKEVQELVEKHLDKPLFFIFGQKRINVLMINQALDQLATEKK